MAESHKTIENVVREARKQYGASNDAEHFVLEYIKRELALESLDDAIEVLEQVEQTKTQTSLRMMPAPSNKSTDMHKEASTPVFSLENETEKKTAQDSSEEESWSSDSAEKEEVREAWKKDWHRVAESWYVGSEIAVYSYSMQEWMEAIIVGIIPEEQEEWLVVEFTTSSGGTAQKEVPRFDKDAVRPLEVDSDDESDSSFDDLPNLPGAMQSDLIGTGAGSDSGSIGAFSDSGMEKLEEIISKKRIIVQVNHAGSAVCNGTYKRDDDDPYLYRNEEFPEVVLTYLKDEDFAKEGLKVWVFKDDEHMFYYAAEDEDEPYQPPDYGWEEGEDGIIPIARVNVFREGEKEEEFVKEDFDIEWQKHYYEIKVTVERRPLGINFDTHNERLPTLVNVKEEGHGAELELEEEDMLWMVNGAKHEDRKDALKAFRETELPFECVFFRRRQIMGVLKVVQAGSYETHGEYTIHGWRDDQFRFTKNEDDRFQIYFKSFASKSDSDSDESESEDESDSEEAQMKGQWFIATTDEEEIQYYASEQMQDDAELMGYPATFGWKILEDMVGDYPVANLQVHQIEIEPPPEPVITKVVPHESKATIYIEYDMSKIVPAKSPRMEGWFTVNETKHADASGHEIDIHETEKTIVVPNLVNGREYKFRVGAMNQITVSSPFICDGVTPLKVPKPKWRKGEKLNLHGFEFLKHNGVEGGDGQVTLHWYDHEAQMNDTRAEYSFEAKNLTTEEILTLKPPDGKKKNISPLVWLGLENGIQYEFTLIASNTSETVRSSPRTMTPLLAPQRPVIKELLNKMEDRCILATFECEDYDNTAICANLIGHSRPNAPEHSKPVMQNPIKITKLTCGKEYEFSCTAFNTTAIVESEVFSNLFIPLWKPPKPKIKSLKIQHNEAELKFSCDDDAIDEYKATYKITTKPKTSTYTLKSEERSCKLTDLNNGVSYEVIVTAQNCLGKSVSTTKSVTPLDFPPQVGIVKAKAKKGYIQLDWSTVQGDINAPKYKAEYHIRTEVVSAHTEKLVGMEVITGRSSHQFWQCKDGVTYRFYVKTVNAIGSSDEVASNDIKLQTQHRIIGKGNGGIGEMAKYLEDDRVFFVLMQIEIGGGAVKRFKNIKIPFYGDKTPNVIRGAKVGMEAVMDRLFKGVHMTLKPFRYKDDVTVEEIFKRAQKVLMDPSDRKIKRSGETLSSIMLDYERKIAVVAERERDHEHGNSLLKRDFRQDSIFSIASDISAASFAPRLNTARVGQIMKILRQKYGWIDWALFSPSDSHMQLMHKDSFGEGGLEKMIEAFGELKMKTECYAVFRVVIKNKQINHYLIHYMTTKRQAKEVGTTRKMLDRLRHNKRVDMFNWQNFNEKYILDELTKDPEKFKKYMTEYQEEMENRNEHIDKVLAADSVKAQLKDDQKALARIKHYVSQVKDPENRMNWMIIDPAEAMGGGKKLVVRRHDDIITHKPSSTKPDDQGYYR